MNKKKREEFVVCFKEKLKGYEEENIGEGWRLEMSLASLLSEKVLFGSNAFWKRFVNYILIIAEKKKISPKQVLKCLFKEKDSEAWMLALQDLNEYISY